MYHLCSLLEMWWLLMVRHHRQGRVGCRPRRDPWRPYTIRGANDSVKVTLTSGFGIRRRPLLTPLEEKLGSPSIPHIRLKKKGLLVLINLSTGKLIVSKVIQNRKIYGICPCDAICIGLVRLTYLQVFFFKL